LRHQVFICHSARDKEVAREVCERLEADGFSCWIAPRDVLPGSVWAAAIHGAIKQSRLLLLIHSEESNDSDQVLRELERAAGSGIAILPLRISDIEPSDAVHYYIGASHWLDAHEPPLKPHLEQLSRSVGKLVGGRTARATRRRTRSPTRTAGTKRSVLLVALVAVLLGAGLALGLALRAKAPPEQENEARTLRRPRGSEGDAHATGAVKEGQRTTKQPEKEADIDPDASRKAAIAGRYELHPDLMREACFKIAWQESLEEAPGLSRDERGRQARAFAGKFIEKNWMDVRVDADGKFISQGMLNEVEQFSEGSWEMRGDVLTVQTLYDDGKKLKAPLVSLWTFRGGIIRGKPADADGLEIILRKKRPAK